MVSSKIIEAVTVTAELTGTSLSAPAAKVLCQDLSIYPEAQVLGALVRCRRELRGRMTLAEIINRLDDGRPGPDEAWAMMPRSEAATVVWTDEMATAIGVALPLLEAGDQVAARMAFKESYQREMQIARDTGRPVKWWVSLGHDKLGRAEVIKAAVEKGRLTTTQAQKLLPHWNNETPALTADSHQIGELIAQLKPNKPKGEAA